MGYRSFHFSEIITYPESALGFRKIQSTLTSAENKSRKHAALHFKLLHRKRCILQRSLPLWPPLSSPLSLERLLASSVQLSCFLDVSALCMRLASARVWVGAVVRRTGPGVLPAVLMAPDCLCAGRMKQAPAGRGAVKRITPALTYPCMVYHPVAKYSYCIWRRRRTTTTERNRRWSFGREPWSHLPYFERF